MALVVQDDRTDDQIVTHDRMVIALDTFMSGWGEAEGGLSYAAWAFIPDDEVACRQWVEGRGDMKNVEVVDTLYRPRSRRAKHLHIYVYRGQGGQGS